ncbi:hypothetical protein LCGC14_1025120 [marine sediment metagenome]|uniref:Uncharacterized protein n=1 Tax=marine sediment metagenome TaxID=412755 RepID=A0A0F9NHW0_9ZZZZ
MENTASINLIGTYNFTNANARQPWGVVENANHRSGLLDVFFPHNPEDKQHGQVALHELLAWSSAGVIEKVDNS